MLVKVVKCSNSGGLSPVGTVDVQPLVHQVDGKGRSTPHGIIYGIPYFRLQGGTDAIIIDPKAGDIGMAAFCSRDISAVKKSKRASNPGSFRKHDLSDGIYFGGMLNGAPTQFLRCYSGGIEIVSPVKVRIHAPVLDIQSDVINCTGISGSGTWNLAGDLNHTAGTITSLGKKIDGTHTHNGVQTGSGNTGQPNA